MTDRELKITRRYAGQVDEPTLLRIAHVYQRHQTAMRVLKRVNDEADRWTLLEYVVYGNPAVDSMLARAA